MLPRQRFNLLCVDDEIAILEGLSAGLEHFGYEVQTAENGFSALLKVKKSPARFQLIITDLRMPGLDGFGFIEQARAAGYGGPFMVYAGMISPDDRQRLNELHVVRIILKPARTAEVIAAIKEIQSH